MFDRVGCGIARVDDCRKQNPADLGRRQQGADAAVGRLVRRKQHEDVHARLVMLGGQRREIARAAEIDEEVKSIIEKAYADCTEILKNNSDKMHLLANYLLKFEKIDGADFEKLMRGEITEDVLKDTPSTDESSESNE